LVIFSLIQAISKLQRKKEAAPAALSTTDQLLMEIRDELRASKRL
jgi:large-conductance mechanosensitive channel